MNAAYPSSAAYGATNDFSEFAPFKSQRPQAQAFQVQKQPRRPGASCLASFLVPTCLFLMLLWMFSFTFGYKSPGLCMIAKLLSASLVAYFGYSYYLVRRTSADPSWFGFLGATSLVAVVAAVVLGEQNLNTNMRPYYDIVSLNTYPAVEPALTRGNQVMDAGRFVFAPGSHIDVTHSMGFKNGDIYCVAPIVSSNFSASSPPATFDFWAVGVNCCSPHLPDFHCGEFANPFASQGIRLMSDSQRAFFRLAAQQAEAAYSIVAAHPIFLHFMQDPSLELMSYVDEGYKAYLVAALAFAGFQAFSVLVAITVFAKLG